MKKTLTLAIAASLFSMSCSKPEISQTVTAKVYTTEILYTNKGEPNIMFWYILPIEKSQKYLVLTNTIFIKDFSKYQFERMNFPVQVYKGSFLTDVQIHKNQIHEK